MRVCVCPVSWRFTLFKDRQIPRGVGNSLDLLSDFPLTFIQQALQPLSDGGR